MYVEINLIRYFQKDFPFIKQDEPLLCCETLQIRKESVKAF
jgi:hypothetical protein